MLAPVFDGRHARKTITSAIPQLSSRFQRRSIRWNREWSGLCLTLYWLRRPARCGRVRVPNERRVHAATGVLPWSELGPYAGTFWGPEEGRSRVGEVGRASIVEGAVEW